MAERRQHPNGGIYERGPDGQWHLVGGANPLTGADPMVGLQTRSAEAEARIKEAQAPNAAAIADAEARKAEADARTAQINAETKAREEAERNSPEARRARVEAARSQAQTALAMIGQIRRSVAKPGATGPIGQIAEYIHGTPAANLSASLDALGGVISLDKLMQMKNNSATGASGLGQVTEKELAILRDQLGALSRQQGPEQLLENLRGVEKHFKRALLAINGVDPDRYEKLGIDPYEKLDPQTARMRAQIMLRQGAGEDKVGEFLTVQGLLYDPSALRANIGRQDARVIPPEDEVAAGFQKGAEHVGSRLLEGVESVPNTLFGTNLNFGDQWRESAERRFAGRGVDPTAEMTGRIAAAAIPALLTRNPFVGGALENVLVNDSRDPMGIGQDALVGGIAGKIGDKFIRGAANLLSPNISQPVRNLHERGVRMTPGQILGGNAARAEGLRTSLPFAGGRIQGSIDQAYDDVQHALGDEILSPAGIGADRSIPPGGAFVKDIQQKGSQLYDDALKGTGFEFDPRTGNRVLKALSKHRMRPDVAAEVVTDLQVNLGGMFGRGGPARITGEEWKAIDSELGTLAESYRKQGAPYNPAARAVREVRDELFRGVVRQNPGSKAAEVRNADKVHRGVRILNNAAARDGANNVPSPGQIMAAIKAEAPAGRTAFAAGEAPLQRFAGDVQNAMPTYANSRSAERLTAQIPTTREGMMAHIQGAMLAPLYTEPVQRAFQGAMLRKSYTMPKTADLMRSDALAGARGMFGSGQARDLLNMDPLVLQQILEEDARLRRPQ